MIIHPLLIRFFSTVTYLNILPSHPFIFQVSLWLPECHLCLVCYRKSSMLVTFEEKHPLKFASLFSFKQTWTWAVAHGKVRSPSAFLHFLFLFFLFLLLGVWLHGTPRIPAGTSNWCQSQKRCWRPHSFSIGRRLTSPSVVQKMEKGGGTKNT